MSVLLVQMFSTMLSNPLVMTPFLLLTLLKLDSLIALKLIKEPTLFPIHEGLIEYLKREPQALLIIQFILLLTCSAVFLTHGNYFLSERFAECAYLFLVVGVLTTLITTIRQKNVTSE